jgi:glycine dehydrogenase
MFQSLDTFPRRHLGPSTREIEEMLASIKVPSLDALIAQTVPASIRAKKPLNLPNALSETDALSELKSLAQKNVMAINFLGMGYHGTKTPGVILRNILLNPGWYTAYTPYQAEIAQGRLEALLNFQTMVCDLTGLPVANASLLDESTAAAEAMHLLHSVMPDSDGRAFFISELCHPQNIEVVKTRAKPLGIQVIVGNHETFDFKTKTFGALLQYPASNGSILNYRSFTEKAHAEGCGVVVAADLLSLTLLEAPGEFGADVCVGVSQRFGVPMGFGGPHAAFMATKTEYARSIPGRIIGVSIDAHNKPALRMALQTREQHIRREKATSNICTAQVLLSVMASMYAVYHGPEGLKQIALRTHGIARAFAAAMKKAGHKVLSDSFFDTVAIEISNAQTLHSSLEKMGINVRLLNAKQMSASFDESTTLDELKKLVKALGGGDVSDVNSVHIPESQKRKSAYMTHPVFNTHHTETEMLRYIRSLEYKDLSLCHSMIALGSCTMKLNATSEMEPVTWPEFNSLHPFAPVSQYKGYAEMFTQLENWLSEITGFAGCSLQPNAGSQGEYAGLLTIRSFHESKKNAHRNICLIPASAHGTNPATATMAGYKVVVTKTDANGNVDMADLKAKALEHKDHLAALMVTYPSTHGVFEESIGEICELIHANGGQVYMDGANMNAQVGLCRPGDFGPDVCHLNLHKTFCIPHGGGGPGMGPICVAKHLVPHLPGHNTTPGLVGKETAVSAAPYGSASILLISWMYIRMMGADGLAQATRLAILNANYMAEKLESSFPVLYRGANKRVAHECIIDMRHFKASSGVEVEDIAKRLMDYGFHAPTVSFPVASTMMIEPTESESKVEMDRFCEALISIRKEIKEIEEGKQPKEGNVLKHAPHVADIVTGDEWGRSYSRQTAAFPLAWVKKHKFWPSVGRINGVAGDRKLVCSCPPVEEYQK